MMLPARLMSLVAATRERVARANSVYHRWAAAITLVIGIALLVAGFMLAGLAIQVSGDQKTSEHQAQVACQRALEFAPTLASFYETRHVLSVRQLRDYRSSIPKHC